MNVEDRVRHLMEEAFAGRFLRYEPVRQGFQSDLSCRVWLRDGSSVFVKLAGGGRSGAALEREWWINTLLPEGLGPRVLEWHPASGGQLATLVFEDFGELTWAPPWHDDGVLAVCRLLQQVAAVRAPEHLPSLEVHRGQLSGWRAVQGDPGRFVRLGLRGAGWLEEHIAMLRRWEQGVELDGESLVHFDVRSDNLCLDQGRAYLVDWAHACRGRPDLDLLAWLPSLRMEGGPKPAQVAPEADPALVVTLAGYWASQAGLPPPPGKRGLRALQRGQLRVALDWMEHALGCAQLPADQ